MKIGMQSGGPDSVADVGASAGQEGERLASDVDEPQDEAAQEAVKRPKRSLPSGPMAAYVKRRKALGMTQTDLAAKLGMSQPNLSNLESGKRPLSAEMKARLRKALKLKVKK